MSPSLASNLVCTTIKTHEEMHLSSRQIQTRKAALRRRWRRTASLEANDKLEKRYTVGRRLGSGSFSTVYECTCRMTQKKFAVKQIQASKLQPNEIISLRREISIGSAVDHPVLCGLVDIFEEDGTFSIVQELAPEGDLFTRIEERECFSEKSAAAVMQRLLQGASYLHSRGIVHRDIKPENILCASAVDDADVRLTDFGFASYVSDLSTSSTGESNDACGTPHYVPPEILKGKDYSTKADIWSLGIVCFAMIGGYLPFDEESDIELFKKIIRANVKFHTKFWGEISTDAKDFIRCMLQPDPKLRRNAEQLLLHPWIRTHCV